MLKKQQEIKIGLQQLTWAEGWSAYPTVDPRKFTFSKYCLNLEMKGFSSIGGLIAIHGIPGFWLSRKQY